MKKTFEIGTVLAITTGRVLGGNFGRVYDILNYMTGDNLFTHQLGRASEECRPHLLRQFPELAKADVNRLDGLINSHPETDKEGRGSTAKRWLETELVKHNWSVELDVEPLPAGQHEQRNPLAELIEMRGSADGIVPIVVP
jgi:hypothetical protein